MAGRSGAPHRGRVPPPAADDRRSQLLAELSAALHRRAVVEHALEVWASGVRSRLDVPVEVAVRLTCVDGRTVAAGTEQQATTSLAHLARTLPVAVGTAALGGSAWWRPSAVPPPFRSVALLSGPVVGAGSVLVALLGRAPLDWRDRTGTTELVDDLRAVLGLAIGLEQAVASVADVDAMLSSRALIDQAVGVVMAHHGCGAEDAMQRLRRASQRSGVPLARLAQRLLTDVSGAVPTAAPRFRPRSGRALA